MYHARKMRLDEFKTQAEHLAKDGKGRPCHYAVEAENGHTLPGLSWEQACNAAEKMNQQMLEAA